MARVVDLAEWRARRERQAEPVDQLEAAVDRLDRLVASRASSGRGVTPGIARELTAIVDAVSSGKLAEAAERARRLAARLEHPAARHA